MCKNLSNFSDVPYSQRVDTVLKWLSGSEGGVFPDLMLLYFDQVDKAGHEAGPESERVNFAKRFMYFSFQGFLGKSSFAGELNFCFMC